MLCYVTGCGNFKSLHVMFLLQGAVTLSLVTLCYCYRVR